MKLIKFDIASLLDFRYSESYENLKKFLVLDQLLFVLNLNSKEILFSLESDSLRPFLQGQNVSSLPGGKVFW